MTKVTKHLSFSLRTLRKLCRGEKKKSSYIKKMKHIPILEETTALIVRDLNLATPAQITTEAGLLDYLSDAVAYMIEHKLDLLMSTLYRLDVDEKKINQALLPGQTDTANVALAKLIIGRQKKRIETKRAYLVNRNVDEV